MAATTTTIGVPNEIGEGEQRVALVPDVVRSLKLERGVEVIVATGAGYGAGHADEEYEDAGAGIVWQEDSLAADVVLAVGPPPAKVVERLRARQGQVLISHLDPWAAAETNRMLAAAGVTSFAIEAIPKTPRAQSMDALASQATAAGCAAVFMAAQESTPFFAMLDAAADALAPARVLVLGSGNASLQASTTARRLGAIVTVFDADAEGEEVRAALAEAIAAQDVVVTDVTTPGCSAPLMITAEAARGMASGSVIVDLAADAGGNCELTKPGETVVEAGVKVLGPRNPASRMPVAASRLYARNLERLLALMVSEEGELKVDFDDDILAAACITAGGEIRNERAAR